mgnify:CR=1 FL=1|jgi:wobble nucleotide-excising tRNase
MIDKIYIKNVATFEDEIIAGLKKVNFVYGSNGSGKTTISNIIQSPLNYAECQLDWVGDFPIPTLVYNKSFKERNFGAGQIPGVFTLGDATKEEIEIIENKRKLLEVTNEKGLQKKKNIETQQKTLEDLRSQFREDVWITIKQKYESTFKDAFIGCLNSKVNFSTKLIDEFYNNHRTSTVFDSLKERAQTLFGRVPSRINPISVINSVNIIDIEQYPIWKKKVLGKADIEISPLIQHLNISDWVNQGRNYIQEDSDICPFCQKKTIDDDFKKQIEDYFSESYTADINTIKILYDEYVTRCQNLKNELQAIIDKEKNNQDSKLNIQAIESILKTLNHIFIANKEIVKSKIAEPSRSLILESTKESTETIQNIIEQCNLEIEKHNKLVANFQNEKSELIADIWKYVIDENTIFLNSFTKKEKGLIKGIEKLQSEKDTLLTEYKNIEKEIVEANKKVTSIQSSVDEINRILSAYGFTNFTIVPVEGNYYQIQRTNGELANDTLSEGEITFITFLYFMRLVRGGTSPEKANENKVIVIDDPISSLDSTILFVVGSLIKEEIKKLKNDTGNIKQIIILTHNIYFHKEASFIDGRTKANNNTYYWIVRKNNNKSHVQCYETENPIRGSYELLWDELKNKDSLSIITIQNTMRRIYETYFKILGKYKDDDILAKITDVQEKEICRSLLCWINDGSHCVPDDLHIIQHDDILERYCSVFRKIFDVMGHIEHYNMMMGIESFD